MRYYGSLSDESLLTLLTGDVIKYYYNTLNSSRLTVAAFGLQMVKYQLVKVTGYPLNNFMGTNFYWPENQLSYTCVKWPCYHLQNT